MTAADTVREAHAGAMTALAADVHPYSGPAVRDWEQQLDAALDALEAERDAAVQAAEEWKQKYVAVEHEVQAAEAERDAALRSLRRATFLAKGLFEMIDPQTWRDHGGDDGQGHYEGDYRAENVREEIATLATLAGNQT